MPSARVVFLRFTVTEIMRVRKMECYDVASACRFPRMPWEGQREIKIIRNILGVGDVFPDRLTG
jgi:hypothetical protein